MTLTPLTWHGSGTALAAATFLAFATGAHCGEVIDFDSQEQWPSLFRSIGTAEPAWNSKEGVAGGGGLVTNVNGYVAGVRTEPVELKPGQTLTVAMSFLYKGQTSRIAERNAGVFLTAEPGSAPGASREGAVLAVYFYNVSAEGSTQLGFVAGEEITMSGKGNLEEGSGWWDAEAMAGHWCQVKVAFTKLPVPDLWELRIKLMDFGESGQEPGREIHSIAVPEVNAKALYSAKAIYPGFQNLRNNRGFRSMDNFEVHIQ